MLALAGVLLVAACAPVMDSRGPPASESGAFPERAYAALAADGVPVYELNPAESRLWIFVFREGALSRFGHHHVLAAESFRGAVAWDGAESPSTRLDLRVPASALLVDPAPVRNRLGGEFAAAVPAEDAAATRANLLGADVLAAERHPWITVRLERVQGALPRPILTLAVTLRGETRLVEVPAAVQLTRSRIVAEGRVVLRQSDFGMAPFSVLGGALRVADRVLLEFRLVGRRP